MACAGWVGHHMQHSMLGIHPGFCGSEIAKLFVCSNVKRLFRDLAAYTGLLYRLA